MQQRTTDATLNAAELISTITYYILSARYLVSQNLSAFARHNDILPFTILLISQSYQQITRHILENLFMFGREMFFPFAGFA